MTTAPAPTCHRITITPTIAMNWLENGNTNNRSVNEAHVHRMARDMKAGRWVLTHAGIALDPHGVLLDGQHRLWAIIESDTSVEMHVWVNVPAEALFAIDTGKPRNMADVLYLGGNHGKVTSNELAVLKAMLAGLGGQISMTAAETSDALAKHREAIRFAIAAMPNCRGISNAVTRAVLARAYYSAGHRNLEEFGRMLVTGVVPDLGDTAVILLRQWLTANTRGGSAVRQERYAKTERALCAYLRDDPISKLYAVTEECFPLPEEVRPAKPTMSRRAG